MCGVNEPLKPIPASPAYPAKSIRLNAQRTPDKPRPAVPLALISMKSNES